MFRSVPKFAIGVGAVTAVAVAMWGAPASEAQSMADQPMSAMFAGAKVNGGMVSHGMTDGKHTLTLSADFKSPDAPDPHWQVVDSSGNTYLLNRLMIKGGITGDKLNRTIAVPAYVPDVAKVRIWCAWAEVVLGEAAFPTPVK